MTDVQNGLLPTGQRLPLTPDLAFTKTALHNLQGGLELCGGTLHTPQGDHAVCWDTDDDDGVTVTLPDGTLLLSRFRGEWERHPPLVQANPDAV